MLSPASSNRWSSQSAFAPLHPDIVSPPGQRGGKAEGSMPEVATLCFRNPAFWACGKSRAGNIVRLSRQASARRLAF